MTPNEFCERLLAYWRDLDLTPGLDEEADHYESRVVTYLKERASLAAAIQGIAKGIADEAGRRTVFKLAIALKHPPEDSYDADAFAAWREAEPILRAVDDSRAKSGVLFSGAEPSSDVDIAIKLAARGNRSMNSVALEFTGNAKGKADSPLSQIRQLRSEGRIVFTDDA